jgi:hypothetical protein
MCRVFKSEEPIFENLLNETGLIVLRRIFASRRETPVLDAGIPVPIDWRYAFHFWHFESV